MASNNNPFATGNQSENTNFGTGAQPQGSERAPRAIADEAALPQKHWYYSGNACVISGEAPLDCLGTIGEL